MTGNNFLLDTNIISALFKGEKIIADKIDGAEAIYIPSIVIGELYYGAEYSTQIDKNISNIDLLIQTFEILAADDQTARLYGKIKARLRKNGTPAPENDIWIAATAQQHQMQLVTRDGHFKFIESLAIANW